MEHTSSEKMAEALKLLEEAATQKKDELKSLMSDKYAHLRSVIAGAESGLGKSLSVARKHAAKAAAHARDVGVEKARELARGVDKSVRRSPWPYIAGSAGVGLLLGFMLSRKRK